MRCDPAAHGLAGDEVAHAAALLVVDHDGRLAVHGLPEINGNLQTAVRHRPIILLKTHQLPIFRRRGQSRMGRLGLVLEKSLALARLSERAARPGDRDPHAQLPQPSGLATSLSSGTRNSYIVAWPVFFTRASFSESVTALSAANPSWRPIPSAFTGVSKGATEIRTVSAPSCRLSRYATRGETTPETTTISTSAAATEPPHCDGSGRPDCTSTQGQPRQGEEGAFFSWESNLA